MKKNSSLPEKYLLDALDRIGKSSSGYAVLYVNISKLKPKNRHPDFVKIIAKLFDTVVGSTKGSFFVLSNGDFVILGKNITHDAVDEAVKKLRDGLGTDPILYEKDSSEFAQIYEFPEKLYVFYTYIENMYKNPNEEEDVFVKPVTRPIEAGEVDEIIEEMQSFDIAEIVKRQSVVQFRSAEDFNVIFQEFFVAVKDLTLAFEKKIDLTANRWLFMYMTQELDKMTLEAFSHSELRKWPKEISINLNLSTIFSKEFDTFIHNMPAESGKLIVEVRLMDVFNDVALYFEARDKLHQHGHKILIDETCPSTLKMLGLNKLAPDMVKLFWEPLLEYEKNDKVLKKLINEIGRDKVVLAKCDGDKAVKWGVAHGITAFQGPFIDSLEALVIKSKCPHASKCSTLDCLKRRRLLSGEKRRECLDKSILEEML